MTNIQIFNHEEFGGVRVIELNGQPFFVGADVANALGYADTFGALKKHVDDEDKTLCQIDSGSRGLQNTVVINESGVYSLILRSNLPKAKEFKRWVTSEVLPSIRKHGVYMTPDAAEKILLNPDFIIQLAQQVKDAQAKIAELQHKASYYDLILNCKDLVSVTKIAKDYGMSGVKFNQLLEFLDVQFRQSGVWILKQKFAKQLPCRQWRNALQSFNLLDAKGQGRALRLAQETWLSPAYRTGGAQWLIKNSQ